MKNRVLRALPDAARRELLSLCEARELPRGSVVELPGKPVQHAHFFEIGFASVLISVGARRMEVGLVGRDGLLGVPAVLGAEIAAYRAVIRHDALVHRIEVGTLRDFMARRRVVGAALLRYVQAGVAQITYTAFANAQLAIPQRVARWLLMAHDRVDGDTVSVTHAMLSESLGVQRSGITLALRDLEGAQVLRTSHAAVTITDREKLMSRTAGLYGPAERAYRLLLGSDISKGQI